MWYYCLCEYSETIVDPIDRTQLGVDVKDNWMRLLLEENDSNSDSDFEGFHRWGLDNNI